jgi:hypothetical protein
MMTTMQKAGVKAAKTRKRNVAIRTLKLSRAGYKAFRTRLVNEGHWTTGVAVSRVDEDITNCTQRIAGFRAAQTRQTRQNG